MHRCGNGALDSHGLYVEVCDDSNTVNGDGCSSLCTIESGYSCNRIDNSEANPDVCTPNCGNSVFDTAEQCDDGNVLSGDGCSATCLVEANWGCSLPVLGTPSVCLPDLICGNSYLQSPEACDDGGTVDGDGCSSVCQVEDGWACSRTGLVSQASPDTCTEVCGDGMIVGSEQCDTADTLSGQCASNCKCSDYALLDGPGNTCVCKETNCTDCITSRCS